MSQTSEGHRSYHADIGSIEYFWVDHQPFLLSRGYKLRPRFDPQWIPKWELPGKKDIIPYYCEDGQGMLKRDVLDAIRVADGLKVVLKRVPAPGDELRIALYLSSSKMRSDPRNRTVSIIDVMALPDDKGHVLLVMPYLRVFDTPPFHCRAEVVEAFRQFLQGLEFMHEHNISHSDACHSNLMMDESRVVPRGSHFARPYSHDGVKFNLTWRHRCGQETAAVVGNYGQIKDVPEFSDSTGFNPFKVDIYQLGRTFLNVIKDYPDLSVFIPFTEHMTKSNPCDRPSATEALVEFEAVVSSLERRKLRARIWRHEDTVSVRRLRFLCCLPAL